MIDIILLIISTSIFTYIVVYYFISKKLSKSERFSEECNDMVDERMFMENLLNQRFNFLALIFGIIIASLITVEESIYFTGILFIGFIIVSLLTLTIFRAQVKLDFALNWIFSNAKKKYAAKLIHDSLKGDAYSVRKLIGYYIPLLLCLILYVLIIITTTTDYLPIISP